MWGFENDDAADWAAGLAEGDDLTPITEALAAVEAAGDEYLEAPEAVRAIAAAEVVAELRGVAGPGVPDEVQAWIVARRSAGVPASVAKAAAQAVARVRTDSELRELWLEPGDAAASEAGLLELETRLRR